MMTMADQTARRPADSFSVRLLTALLLIRIGASGSRWAVRRVFN
jgi:hypothetical protein